jgi:Flp pilus assembly protein TadD
LFISGTAWRANLFADSILLCSDATRKTSTSTVAPYLLGYAWERRKNETAARSAYEEVLRRNGQDEATRSATNNLARLEVRRGALAHAETLLRRGIQQFPDDGKMRDNLAKVLFREGKVDEARRVLGFPPPAPKPSVSSKQPPVPPKPSTSSTAHRHRQRPGSHPLRIF